MASDLTPERRDFLRDTANLESGIVLVAKEELLALLDTADRADALRAECEALRLQVLNYQKSIDRRNEA